MAENKEAKNNKIKKTFFKDLKAELKKVTWPTAKQVIHNTGGVIIIVIITAVIVFALDFTFKNFNEHVVNGIKVKINEMSVVENTIADENVVDNDSADNTVETNTVENEDNKE